MSRLKKINQVRRKFMKMLTKNIGRSTTHSTYQNKDHIKNILINRPNARLGNLLLITPLLQEVSDTYPDCKIDVFVKGGLSPILFKNYKNIDQVITLPSKPFHQLPQYIATWFKLKKKSYDLVINVIPTSSSGRLSTKIARSKYKIFGELNHEFEDSQHLAKHPVYAFREFRNDFDSKKTPILDIKLNKEELIIGKNILDNLVGNNKPTICIFTYATGDKCYSKEWWEEMYRSLKVAFQEFNIIEVLPKENVSQISFQAKSFYSRDIREIAALISNTSLFLGADSGMMHLASAANTPTLGLFCITNPEKYAPYNSQSTFINTTEDTISDCIIKIKDILKKNDAQCTIEKPTKTKKKFIHSSIG